MRARRFPVLPPAWYAFLSYVLAMEGMTLPRFHVQQLMQPAAFPQPSPERGIRLKSDGVADCNSLRSNRIALHLQYGRRALAFEPKYGFDCQFTDRLELFAGRRVPSGEAMWRRTQSERPGVASIFPADGS